MDSPVPVGLVRRLPMKRRRTATSVLAGDFDARPARDVLTSLLNGIGPYERVEGTEEQRRARKQERRRREKEWEKKKHSRKQNIHNQSVVDTTPRASAMGEAAASKQVSRDSSTPSLVDPHVNNSTSSFWRTRGPVVIATRSVSPSPPPELSSPPTPGPSISSSMSFGSSKRPHTPDDDFFLNAEPFLLPPAPKVPRERKKRVPARKGWKGWVEGSPPPSEKLINLDEAPIMVERRTRSGKNFDAISTGKEDWVNPGASSSKTWATSGQQ